MLKRILLVLALLAGAFALAPSTGQATPLGVAAQVATDAPTTVETARWRRRGYYRRRWYRPRRYVVRRYYYPRRHFYRRAYYPRRHYYRRAYYRRYW